MTEPISSNNQQSSLDVQQLREERSLILNQIDNAIALFNDTHQLILFNQKLADIWGLSPEFLNQKPPISVLISEILLQGYWEAKHCQQLQNCLEQVEIDNLSFCIEQNNRVCLEIESRLSSNGSRLFTFRDITYYRNSQASLNTEVRRLRFLLGLNERLQNSDNLQEIAQFALNYLVSVMDAAFGDVKVISGEGKNRQAGAIVNQISGQFIATYGEPAIASMQEVLNQGIPYGQGLLWDVVETGEPLFVDNYAQHPKSIPRFREPGLGRLGIFPIPATNGNIIGVLTLESRDLDRLQEYPQRDMLNAACRTLGASIERIQAQARLQQINEDLERASQLKSEFLASMSHELRTPLNSILGFSDLLKRQIGGPLNERQLNHLQLIEKSGQHLLQLINDILDLSKIEAGKTELDLQSVDIHLLCNECLKMMQPRADKKRLKMSVELDYRVHHAFLDERRVRQIIINLLSNAVKFTPEAGSIKLSGFLAYGSQMSHDYRPDCSPVNASTPYLCLEVQDSGIGIPEDRWHLLFRPFQQVDSALTRRHEGTGLGLALVKRLAELHGGTVSISSIVNQGSLFRAWLPLTEMRGELSLNPESCDLSLQKLSESLKDPNPDCENSPRILVVEDQPFNQLLVSEVLELEGYRVELISNGQTMLEAIQSPLVTQTTLPNLILMDVQLPEVDGLELMRQLKAHSIWQSVPIIALTAMAMSGDRERCLDAGASAYLSKPLDLDLMLVLVKSFIPFQSEIDEINE
ncbi:hybrid sensor histidine kinase/response regulator [Planktothrix paucivesiculata]|uniref:Circadian input-output histidine kinase CikA n=1 Tax=Planktothrix paucivesiculata PCC 9631 TaxID=671071 RepID=A0A7Z9BV94_9CYAN|nr:ATP-binding protein [Planktothrix paucivesiculata]VXD22083.1 Two-component hybrid sensor and regulator [Planktothrix paucivesiculata PCC 9631]